jgi:hypothetical protein
MFGISDGEIAIGAFDVAPTDLVPTYELWGRGGNSGSR